VWPFVAFWRFIKWIFKFVDDHAGAVTAIATLTIAVLTYNYAKYSKKQWETAERQLRDFEDVQAAQLTLDLLPKITEIDGSADIEWNPIITNGGSTMATEIGVERNTYDVRGTHGEYAEPQPVPKPIPNPKPAGDNLPGGKSRQYPDPVPEEIAWWGKVISRESTLITRWDVSYRDIFNRPRVVPFCFYYHSRSKTFLRCPPYTQSK
jgi:hypothetical protein